MRGAPMPGNKITKYNYLHSW